MVNKHLKQKIAFGIFGLASAFLVLPILGIAYYLLLKGLPAINWTFLTAPIKTFIGQYGVMQATVGTMYLLAGTALISVPVGILAAIYLTEYARDNLFTRMVRLAIVNLSGVPSIVFGLFGFGLFVLTMNLGRSILAGSLTLALMTLPVIITSTEEALRTVPKSFRDGSLALGATKWQTIWRVVLPNAVAGIITGIILGVGRAAGETAPIIFMAAATMRGLPTSWKDQCMALPFQLYQWTQEGFDIPESAKWGTALTLLLLVLGMSAIASIIRTRFRRSRTW